MNILVDEEIFQRKVKILKQIQEKEEEDIFTEEEISRALTNWLNHATNRLLQSAEHYISGYVYGSNSICSEEFHPKSIGEKDEKSIV